MTESASQLFTLYRVTRALAGNDMTIFYKRDVRSRLFSTPNNSDLLKQKRLEKCIRFHYENPAIVHTEFNTV